MPGEGEGQRKKEEHGTSHSFAYPKHRRYMSNFPIILSKPPMLSKRKKNITQHISKSETMCMV